MPAKPATFERSFHGFPPEFCHDEDRNGINAVLPPHLNAYFMDLDEFFQATNTTSDNQQSHPDRSDQDLGISRPINGTRPTENRTNYVPQLADVETPPPSVVGLQPEHDQELSRCEFPVYQQHLQNFVSPDVEDLNNNFGEKEVHDDSAIDLEPSITADSNWSNPSNGSDCSSSCRFDGMGTNYDSSNGSESKLEMTMDHMELDRFPLRQTKKRGGGKPGRKRKREYIYDPKPLQHKVSQTAVPDGLKTNDYWERRKRNNLAAKRSRENRREKEMEVLNKCRDLEQENAQIKATLRRLEMRNAWLEKAISEYLKGMSKSSG